MDSNKDPWDQLPEETHAAFLAFTIFKDLGAARKLNEAARLYRIQRSLKPRKNMDGTISDWVTKNRWHDRASAWDEHVRKQREAATLITQDQEYIKALEEYRKNILKGGQIAIRNAINSTVSVSRMNQMFNTTIAAGQRLAPNDYDQFVTNNKVNRDAIGAMKEASDLVERALGVTPVLEKLQVMNAQKQN
jgi:hypothetical protein